MVKQKDYITRVNEGVAISFMDRYTIYDKVYFELAKQAAEKACVKYQIKQGTTGGNDAGSTHSSRGGVRAAALSLPCRYLHCPTSLASTNDLNSLEKTLKVLAEKIAGGEGE
jgi:endoglucanase